MRPNDRKYAQSHEWVKLDGDVAIIGITDFAVQELSNGNESDLVYCDLPDAGRMLAAGETFGETAEALIQRRGHCHRIAQRGIQFVRNTGHQPA